MSVFVNPAKSLFVRVTAFWVNLFSIVNIVNIYKKYSFFVVFVAEKSKAGFINSKIIVNNIIYVYNMCIVCI